MSMKLLAVAAAALVSSTTAQWVAPADCAAADLLICNATTSICVPNPTQTIVAGINANAVRTLMFDKSQSMLAVFGYSSEADSVTGMQRTYLDVCSSDEVSFFTWAASAGKQCTYANGDPTAHGCLYTAALGGPPKDHCAFYAAGTNNNPDGGCAGEFRRSTRLFPSLASAAPFFSLDSDCCGNRCWRFCVRQADHPLPHHHW